ncbi:phosphotransferase (plasmid) [Sinorhizobium meliloti]|nr:phosphotransferase [Sinorhizobium meliloti]
MHNDANDYNVLVGADGCVSGLLDFGDMVESNRVVEVAVASAYALIGSPDPIGAIVRLAGGYHRVNPLGETEAELIFDLVRTRYAVSMCMAARQIRDNPRKHLSARQPGGRLAGTETPRAREPALFHRPPSRRLRFCTDSRRPRGWCGGWRAMLMIFRASSSRASQDRNQPSSIFSANSSETWAGLDKDVAQARIEAHIHAEGGGFRPWPLRRGQSGLQG